MDVEAVCWLLCHKIPWWQHSYIIHCCWTSFWSNSSFTVLDLMRSVTLLFSSAYPTHSWNKYKVLMINMTERHWCWHNVNNYVSRQAMDGRVEESVGGSMTRHIGTDRRYMEACCGWFVILKLYFNTTHFIQHEIPCTFCVHLIDIAQ